MVNAGIHPQSSNYTQNPSGSQHKDTGSTPAASPASDNSSPASSDYSHSLSSSSGKPLELTTSAGPASPEHSKPLSPEPPPATPSNDTNPEVDTADEETLNTANPPGLTIAQGSMKTLKFFYLATLLFLPELYLSRVKPILECAEMCMKNIEHMAVAGSCKCGGKIDCISVYLQNPFMDPAFIKFSSTWNFFIDSLIYEWRTFNIVSFLISGAVLTLLQTNSAASDPLVRSSALLVLVCATTSALCACMCTVRFAMMKRACKGLEWAEETNANGKTMLWNAWVLLALPAAWFFWSLIFFMTNLMAFVWRIGGQHDPLPDAVDIYGRIVITGVFVVGIVHLTAVLITLRTYGRTMDAKCQERVEGWAQKRRNNITSDSVPGQTLASSCVHNCPSRFPPAVAYTPMNITHTQLPFLSWSQVVNQSQRDLPLWQMPQYGAMNGAYTPCIPSQPLDASQDRRTDLQSPSGLGSASGCSS